MKKINFEKENQRTEKNLNKLRKRHLKKVQKGSKYNSDDFYSISHYVDEGEPDGWTIFLFVFLVVVIAAAIISNFI